MHPIRFGRKKLMWTQDHLANYFGLSKSTISNWEKGKVKIPFDLLQEMEMVFGNPRLRADIDAYKV